MGAGETDSEGRVLDRLAGCEQVILPEMVWQCLEQPGRSLRRACRISREVMFWVMIGMSVFTDRSIRQVFKSSRFFRIGEETPSRSDLCQGRQRLGIAPLRRMFELLVRPLGNEGGEGGSETRGVFYCGMRLMGIDSTVKNLPDSEANARTFGRPSGGNRGPGAFPQIRKTSLVELGTHAEIAFVLKPCHRSETVAVPALLKRLPANSLLLLDRGFFSYSLWKQALSAKSQLLVRMKKNAVLDPIKLLADGSYLAKIYPSQTARRQDVDEIVVRVICYSLVDPQHTGFGEKHLLMTSLLDPVQHPALLLIVLYHERWEHESTFDEQKTHHDPRRPTKPAQLRSKTPAGVVQEMSAMSIGHYVIRTLMCRAAERVDLDPDALSFTGCFQVLQTRLPECRSRTPEEFSEWCDGLLWELSRERLEPRRNRLNPRVIKQKMSKWPKKRPAHRHQLPLTQPFAEMIVILR